MRELIVARAVENKIQSSFVGFLWEIIRYQKVWPDLRKLGTGADLKVFRKA